MEHTLLYSFLIILLAGIPQWRIAATVGIKKASDHIHRKHESGPAVCFPTQTPAVSEVTSKRSIVHAFVEGLKSLQSFADSLQICDGHQPDLERDLLPGLRASLQNMSRAQEVCQVQVTTLRSCQDEYPNRIKALKDQLRLLEARLKGLEQQLSGLLVEEASSRQGVDAARRALDAAQSALDQITQQAENAQKMFNVHLKHLLHLNLFKISFMISDNGAVSSARIRVNEAQRSLDAQLNTLKMYVTQCQSCRQSINDTLRSIDDIKRKIRALPRCNKQDTSLQQQFTDFLTPMSQCNAFLRTMVGSLSGAKQEAYLKNVPQLLDSLVPVLDGLVKAVRPLVRHDSTYQLLVAVRLYTIIDKLEQGNYKIKKSLVAKKAVVENLSNCTLE